MLLLHAKLRDEPLWTHLTLLSRWVKEITHHDTPESASRSIMEKSKLKLFTHLGCTQIACWDCCQLLGSAAQVNLGQTLPGPMLSMFQCKGTFAAVAVTHTALMSCSGHLCVFGGHWDSGEVQSPACSVTKDNCGVMDAFGRINGRNHVTIGVPPAICRSCFTLVVLPALQSWKPIKHVRADHDLDARRRILVPEGSCFHFLLWAATSKEKPQRGSAVFAGAPAAKGSASSLCMGFSTAHGNRCCDSPV